MTMCAYFGTIRLIIILWTSICLQDAQAIRKPFKVVERCPFNESEWKVRAVHVTCNGSESYHCLLTEGGVSMREQCTEASLFTSGFCPIFTNEGYLQWSPCEDAACPASSYRSDQVYQYQICYRKMDNPIGENTEQGSNNSNSVTRWTIIIVVAIFLFFVLVLVVFYKKNLLGFRDKVQQHLRRSFQNTDRTNAVDEEWNPPCLESLIPGRIDETDHNTEKLEELLSYVVQILKQELGVNELKEKAVIHSNCINEHFSEPLMKDLQSLKDISDYSRLDISLIFALLRNFCEGIKPPSRGWDCEPPDDEIHVAADIERIRLMWNKYCDNDLQFKQLDEVYNRMKQKYGTVAVHGDEGVRKCFDRDEGNAGCLKLMRNKIRSIQLNEDCTVREGIVITKNINTALKILKSRNVVILKGVIGCGKTYALKAIQNHFQETLWDTAFVKFENFEGKISYEEPTILFWDNLFGKFGTSVFSQDAINNTEKVLKEIYSSKQTKVVIGIHTHVYDEVNRSFKLNFLHQKKITVEIDTLSDAETLLIFKEQLKKGHCKKDSNCWFKTVGFQSVLEKLSKNQGHIGGPFLSLMYCNQHELFSDEAFTLNPVQTLMKHFQRMRQDSHTRYDCLIYLLCVQQHTIEKEPERWAGQISVEITKHNLMDLAKTSGLLEVDNKSATFAHELLTTVLFKSVAETVEIWQENFLPVLQVCKSDVFLQLLRPTGSTHSDLYFEYMYDFTCKSVQLGKMCAYRLASKYKVKEMAHPLMSVEFVGNKYSEYINREPRGLHMINV